MPQLRCTVEQQPFLAQMYFVYESAGKCHRKYLSSGDECFESICTNGHKIVKLRTCKAAVVHALKQHDPVARIHFCNQFLQSGHRVVHRMSSIRVQKIQDLFINSPFMTKELVFGVQ